MPTANAMARILRPRGSIGFGISAADLVATKSLLMVLARVLEPNTPPPAVVPTWNYGVQVEWHRNGVDLEIEADPSGNVEFFFKRGEFEDESSVQGRIPELAGYARDVL